VIGGIGLGLGYISPVSTLVKWFPDRRGMATGMAIMGFGGGAMIGSPLANLLMNYFKTPTDRSASGRPSSPWASIYFVFMTIGAFSYRITPAELEAGRLDPAGYGECDDHHRPRASRQCAQDQAVLADLGRALPERVGRHRRHRHGLADAAGNLRGQADRRAGSLLQPALGCAEDAIAGIAAGFVGLLSLFNIGGRFFWASLSDKLGRKNTYYTFFILGIVLYALVPTFAAMGSKVLFVLAFGIILSMYGGGFATIPAYLADIFGTQFVGAIHGRLLTAWATAGIVGPVVVNYIREFQIAAGVPRAQVYDFTMYILAGMLVLGLICNMLVKPLAPHWFMKPEEVAKLQAKGAEAASAGGGSYGIGKGGFDGAAIAFWAFVGVPLCWGVWLTLQSAARIFQ
jgi:MFS family permease